MDQLGLGAGRKIDFHQLGSHLAQVAESKTVMERKAGHLLEEKTVQRREDVVTFGPPRVMWYKRPSS